MIILGYWFALLNLFRTDGFKMGMMCLISASFLGELVKNEIKLDWTHFVRMGTALLIFRYWYEI